METASPPSRPWCDAVARRPAAAAAAVFIGGIVSHPVLPVWPVVWGFAAIVAAGVGIVFIRRRVGGTAIVAAIFLCALAAAQLQAFRYSPRDIAHFAGDEMRLARVELLIDEPLRIIGTNFHTARPMPPKQVTSAKVVRVLTHIGWTDATAGSSCRSIRPTTSVDRTARSRAGDVQRPSPA